MKAHLKKIMFVLSVVFPTLYYSQVGIGTTTPQSILDINSTTSGVLLPRVTEFQRDYISNPIESMVVYVTDATVPGFYYFNGTSWEILANSKDGYLEKVTENGVEGFRIKEKAPYNYGDIGAGAVDLSESSGMSSSRGATGNYAFTAGFNTIASGHRSVALGNNTNASGEHSFAVGVNNLADQEGSVSMGRSNMSTGLTSYSMGMSNNAVGDYSVTYGVGNYANSYGESAVGVYNTVVSPATGGDSSIISSDRVFSVGIGTGSGSRADALEVFKNGKIYADGLDVSEITDNKQLATKEYVDTNDLNENNFLSSVNEDTSNKILNFSKGVRLANLEYNSIGSLSGGELIYDMNFYEDTGYGTGNGSPDNTFTGDGGGLVINNGEDGWSAVFDTRNIQYANLNTNNMLVQGNQVWHAGNSTPGYLGQVTESGKTGYRISAYNPANFGDIGTYAVDLSFSPFTSTLYGAKGNYSFATGYANKANGLASFVGGWVCSASAYSIAHGYSADAVGNYSGAFGRFTEAQSYGEFVVGTHNTLKGAYSSGSFLSTDRIFTVGNGTSGSSKSDAFTVYKNGAVQLHPVNDANITNATLGMIIVDSSDSNKLKFYNGTTWKTISFEP